MRTLQTGRRTGVSGEARVRLYVWFLRRGRQNLAKNLGVECFRQLFLGDAWPVDFSAILHAGVVILREFEVSVRPA